VLKGVTTTRSVSFANVSNIRDRYLTNNTDASCSWVICRMEGRLYCVTVLY
jgi:hypothetical protein